MSRRERLERVCKILEGPDTVLTWHKDVVAELRLLWAKDDAGPHTCRYQFPGKGQCKACTANDAYEADNDQDMRDV